MGSGMICRGKWHKNEQNVEQQNIRDKSRMETQMTSQERKALLLLREELDRMRILHREFGFGILRCSLPLPPRDLCFWRDVQSRLHRTDPYLVRSVQMLVGRVESFPERREAVRWWGDVEGIEAYKAWSKRAYAFFKSHSALLAVRCSEYGWYELLRTLCSLAASSPELSFYLKETIMEDREEDDNNPPRVDSKATEDTLRITCVHVFPDAITFTLHFLDHVAGATVLQLEINKNDNIAVLNGTPYPLHHFQTLILSLLLDANGKWLSSREMIEAQPLLAGERIDRRVKTLPKAIRTLVKPEKSKGYRLLLS
jgi:hypothetical protein